MTGKLTEQWFTDMTDAIYVAHFGHLDDKAFADAKRTEIEDWLREGEEDMPPSSRPSRESLVAEWGDYDAADIATQRS